MILPADVSLPTVVPLIVLAVTSIGGVLTWWVNGIRSERARLQTLYADAYAAVVSYQEFPFMIRRRRAPLPGQEQIANDERIRIADALQAVQEKLSNYTAQIRAESTEVSATYDALVHKTRLIDRRLHARGMESAALGQRRWDEHQRHRLPRARATPNRLPRRYEGQPPVLAGRFRTPRDLSSPRRRFQDPNHSNRVAQPRRRAAGPWRRSVHARARGVTLEEASRLTAMNEPTGHWPSRSSPLCGAAVRAMHRYLVIGTRYGFYCSPAQRHNR